MKERIRAWFFSKGRLQIFSVLVAFVAWFVVHSGQTVQQRVDFNLSYVNLPSHLIFKKDPPQQVRILLTGSFHRVRSMDGEEKVYLVDLSQARAGMNSVDIDLSNLRLPLDVLASNPVPRRLDFQLEELQKKEIPMKVNFSGKPAEGHVVTNVTVTPNPLQVVGPASALESVQELNLNVPLEAKSQSFSTSVLIELNVPQTKTVDSALVEVEISRLNQERELPKVRVQAAPSSDSVKVSPPTARLILKGTEEKLKEIEKNLKVLVPTNGLKRGRYRVRPQVELVAGVELVTIEPESFIVEVVEE